MTSRKAPVTLSYRKKGLQPPVYVAGTFSDPAWEPQEMQCVSDESGENHFAIQVVVEPGKEYQYRFKAGGQDDWVLDEYSTVVKDDQGRHANLLKVPATSGIGERALTPMVEATERQADRSPALAQGGIVASSPISSVPPSFKDALAGSERRSGTPITQVANTAAEVADTAAKLDKLELSQTPKVEETTAAEVDPPGPAGSAPLFAHESLGAYELVDTGYQHDSSKSPRSSASRMSSSIGSLDEVDLDDPTLERFPSDRSSVLETLRKIQSSTDEAAPALDESDPFSKKTSIDPIDDVDSPRSPTSVKKGEKKTARNSLGATKPQVSLGAIAEEPKANVRNVTGEASRSVKQT